MKKIENLLKENAAFRKRIKELENQHNLRLEKGKQLQFALEAAIAGTWELDLKTGSVSYGKLWEKHMGYTGEIEKTMAAMKKIVHPDDLQQSMEDLNSYLTGKKYIFETECRLLKKDGDYIWVVSRGKAVEFDDKGTPVRLTGVNIDITERKNAEKTLKEEENRYRMLFDMASDGIFVHDQNGAIINVNIEACNSLGYTHEELLKMNVIDFEIGVDLNDLKKLWNNLEKEPITLSVEHKRKDCTIFPVEVRLQAFDLNAKKYFIALTRDITNQKRAEKQKEFIKTIYNAADNVAFVMTGFDEKDTRIRDFSPGAEAIFGYKKEEIIGEHVKILRPAEFQKEGKAVFDSLKKGKIYHRSETIFKRKSGEYFPALSTIYPISNSDGKITSGLGVTIDISDLKKKEEVIIKSKEKYKQLFRESERRALENKMLLQSAKIVLESRDFKRTARYIFDACRKITGAKSGYVGLLSEDGKNNEVLLLESGGMPCTVNSSLPMPIRGLCAEAYRSGKVVYENDFINSKWIKYLPGGHVELKNIIFSPLNVHGKTVGIIVLANKPEDFTEKDAIIAGTFGELAAISFKNIQMEEQLKKERDFANIIIDTAQAIILLLNTEGQIVRINPYMEQLTGYKEHEIKGKNWFKTFIPENYQSKIQKKFKNTIVDINTTGSVNPIITRDGKLLDIIWYNNILKDSNGNVTGVLAVGQNITEQLQIEERLRQSEKMEAIGNLAGGIAHDFNNILGGIIGYSELSLDSVIKGSILENNFNKILKAANRAKNLVRQILTFSRQNLEEKKVIFLASVIKEAVTLLKASIPASINVQIEIREETRPVLADSTKLHELILNIATNSVYAMEQKGVLFIHIYEEDVDESFTGKLGEIDPGHYSILEITDTGCGMDEVTISRIFDPFFTTKPVGEGTGMGLSVVFGIVQSHNGNIIIDSAIGKGTTFRIYFPQTDDPVEIIAEGSKVLLTGTESILFVDDEDILADIGNDFLSSLGYKVISTTSSENALNIIKKEPDKIDLLITDQTMPLMTGIELTEEALKIKPDLPIIICTGYNNQIDPEKAKSLGIARFFMKPFSWHEMSKAIRELLGVKQV